MDILDFEGSATPIVMCDAGGKVIGKNSAAKRLTPNPRLGSILNISAPICRLPQGRCFVVCHQERIWLVFCDFLRFDFDGAIFPTTREVMMLSGLDLLEAIAANNTLKKSKNLSHLSRLRKLLYDKFAFLFSSVTDPRKVHSTSTLMTAFQKVLSPERVLLTTSGPSSRLVNTRNATVILTSLISILMPHSIGRVKSDMRQAGDDLRLSVRARTDIPFDERTGDDITELFEYFPEHTADLFAIDLCVRTCEYNAAYEIKENGDVSVDVYVKTENDLYALLDPAA